MSARNHDARKPLPPDELVRARKLYDEDGLPLMLVAQMLGRNERTVRNCLKDAGVKIRGYAKQPRVGITKVCSKCGATKDLSEFPPCTKRRDGHLNRCRVCHQQYQRELYKELRVSGRRTRRALSANAHSVKHRQREEEDATPAVDREEAAHAYLNELLAKLLPPHLVEPVTP